MVQAEQNLNMCDFNKLVLSRLMFWTCAVYACGESDVFKILTFYVFSDNTGQTNGKFEPGFRCC